jgi:hypothetical protein
MMDPAKDSGLGQRRSLRRGVQLDCGLWSRLWSGSLRFEASDLSAHGVWLDADLALEPGEAVHVRLVPPRWPAWSPPLEGRARVARVSLNRRPGDTRRSGMGLTFLGLSPVQLGLLSLSLRGLPPPLPGALARPRRLLAHDAPATGVPFASAHKDARAIAAPSVRAADLRFVALGPLLTAGQLVVPPPAGRAVVIPFPAPALDALGPRSMASRPLRLVRVRRADRDRAHTR